MDITSQLLQEARSKISFDINKVTPLLYGSAEYAKFVKDFHLACSKIPEVQTNNNFYNLNRKKQFISKGPQFVEMNKLMDGKSDDLGSYMAPITYAATTNYYGVFYGMMVPAIKILGTDEQVKAWYDDCLSLKISGCYAQTELGHGSDVQSLQTTATYDKASDSFVINTPTIEATKFWPGDLGLLANWALVFAQLIVDGKNYGVQSFMVPIRCPNTHKPLPGITVGDIGPKIGYSTKDNGFLAMNNVKIPRFNMLSRFTTVCANGNVTKQGNPKVQYSSMMLMRKLLITVYPRSAAAAMTIAIRYSITRQQFTNDKGVENSVLEYQTQQDKLLPLLANLYSIIFTGVIVGDLVDQNFELVKKGDFHLMNVCHALLSGTKANFTYFVIHCAEWCRLSCGGHGYAQYSGLPSIYQENAPNVTLEGENQIMYLQLSRYLLKLLKQSQKTPEKIPTQFELFRRIPEIMSFKSETFQESHLLKLLESYVILQITKTAQNMMEYISQGIDPKEVWDFKIGTDLFKAGNNFVEYFKYLSFLNTIKQCGDVQVQQTLTKLAHLFATQIILEDTGVLIEGGVITPDSLKAIREYKETLLPIIKQEAIGLVDAFQIIDQALRTTIGKYDGKPYEHTYQWAMNENSVNNVDTQRVLSTLKNMNIKSKL